MQISTLSDVFLRATSRGSERAMLFQDRQGAWKPVSCDALYWRVHRVAAWMQERGVTKGDRVALIAENRPEWAIVDFACLTTGVVDVPMFPTLTAEQTIAQMRDCGARMAFVANAELAGKVARAGAVETVVVMDDPVPDGCVAFESLVEGDEPTSRDALFDDRARAIAPGDLATIIYTSGTTGDAKGVMLTHGNVASNLSMTTTIYAFGPADLMVSFLPLSHVTARHIDYLFFAENVTLAYVGRPERVLPAMLAVKPTIFVAVPRVFERVRQSVESKAAKAGGWKARIFRWAIDVGARHRQTIATDLEKPSSLPWKLADRLVYGKLREAFGGRVHTFVAGGAPLGIDLARWFADAGVAILEGYGLTETSPVIAVNRPGANKLGTVGQTMPNLECRIAEDGELEVRGPSVFAGYWEKPEATADVFDQEGWFRTGDIGAIDADGFLSITDRKRELLKTTGGKMIAPQPIENKLKVSALIGHVALQGDRRKYISALISPNFPALEEWAKDHGISFADRRSMLGDTRVIDRFQRELDRVNADLSPWESVKRFRLLPEEFTIESGELTPSMKLKRRIVSQRYAQEIEHLYAGVEAEDTVSTGT